MLRATYVQKIAGREKPIYQMVGDGYVEDGVVRVGLNRDFPATLDDHGNLVYRCVVSQPKPEEGQPAAPPLFRKLVDSERLVVRADVAGVETPVVFGRAFVNNGATSVTLSCATLPLAIVTDGGPRRVVTVSIEKAPEREPETDSVSKGTAGKKPF